MAMTDSQIETAGKRQHAKYELLISLAKRVAPAKTVVVHPCDETSLLGATEAAEAGIIVPILVGPPRKIAGAAQRQGYRCRALRKSSRHPIAMEAQREASS